jgi:type I restriction enzyme M protein
MDAIETDSPSLKGVLSKDYARPALYKQRLGELIDLISYVGLGEQERRSKDVLGCVYEYFLGKFASAERKLDGEFYTRASVVRSWSKLKPGHKMLREYERWLCRERIPIAITLVVLK